MDIYGTMSKSEARKLSPEQKKLRAKYQRKIYYQNNKEKLAERRKIVYYEKNKEKILKSIQDKIDNKIARRLLVKTPDWKYNHPSIKKDKFGVWKYIGLIATPEELERIFYLFVYQKRCNACDIVLTDSFANRANMNHCKKTGRFQHIICGTCNINDKWQDYFC